ncbi:O-methyl transferase B [Apodospora peruviana]|uniref:O-methyl transferase B n=1 Tax=Apodospora peruviana TaxID=516989 RepID=A0AAE0HZ55_9PEZI|nr:O-methyl transferase B [Apodospora peruviana]
MKVPSIFDQLAQLTAAVGATLDDAAREKVIVALHKAANSLETPENTIHRYGHMNLQTASVKIGFDLGIFKLLAASEGGLTVDEVSQKTGADTELTNRILRFLASIDAVDEIGKDRYAANHVTKNLTEKMVEAGLSHYFLTASPQYQGLPAYLKKTNYKTPIDEVNTCFQDVWNRPNAYALFTDHPENLTAFNDYMALRRKPDLTWLSVYPVAEEAKDSQSDPDRPVFVNIGGGVGHQCAQFKEKYPDLAGRVILQDMPHSIAKALPTPGVENMVHDIFQPQPIKGAKFYHMRGVLHNHPPHKVRKLLEHIKSVMAPDSVLLVDEMVLPETGVSYDVASLDMTMMGVFASLERTEAQWRDTFRDVGLELVRTYTYMPLMYESVMDVRLPKVA